MGIVNAYVVFLLHALNELLDECIERSVHLHLLETLAHLFVDGVAFEQGLFNGAAELIQRVFTVEGIAVRRIFEPALQKIVRERTQEILEAHFAGRIGNVF